MSGFDADLQFLSSLKTRKGRTPQMGKVRNLRIPLLGRLALTRDPGTAGLFATQLYSTQLRATVRDPQGRFLREINLGAGKVTNVGALALAYDLKCPGVKAAPANLFANLQYHGWGTGSGTEKVEDIKLETPATWEGGAASKAKKATTSSITASGTGAPKLVSVAKLVWPEAAEAKITEWGIFTQELLEATTGEPLTAESATSGTVTGTPFTASSNEALGETLKILNFSESEEGWGLIVSNTTSVVTVPAWYKQSSGAEKQPTATSKYKLRPVMFDHRTFGTITLAKGNSIEFTWELEVKSGG